MLPQANAYATIRRRAAAAGIATKLGNHSWVFLLNPITDIVLTFQRAIYGQVSGAKTVDGVTTITKILPQGVDQWWYLYFLKY